MFLLGHGAAQTMGVICRDQVLNIHISEQLIVRRGREGHGAAALTDGSGNVLLLGGYTAHNTAEIVPRKRTDDIG